jgi:hypothetical protein
LREVIMAKDEKKTGSMKEIEEIKTEDFKHVTITVKEGFDLPDWLYKRIGLKRMSAGMTSRFPVIEDELSKLKKITQLEVK